MENVEEDSIPRQVWVQSFMPYSWDYISWPVRSPTNPPDPNDPDSWDWNSWFRCTTIGTGTGCSAASIGCIISSVAYPLCLGVGCAASAVGSAVGCAIAEIWSMADEGHPDSTYTSQGESVLK